MPYRAPKLTTPRSRPTVRGSHVVIVLIATVCALCWAFSFFSRHRL